MTQQQDLPAHPSPDDLIGVSFHFVAKRIWWEIPRVQVSFPLARLNEMLDIMFRNRIFYLAEEDPWKLNKLTRVANEAFNQEEEDEFRAYFKTSLESSLELFPEYEVDEIYKLRVGGPPPFFAASESTQSPPMPPTPPSP